MLAVIQLSIWAWTTLPTIVHYVKYSVHFFFFFSGRGLMLWMKFTEQEKVCLRDGAALQRFNLPVALSVCQQYQAGDTEWVPRGTSDRNLYWRNLIYTTKRWNRVVFTQTANKLLRSSKILGVSEHITFSLSRLVFHLFVISLGVSRYRYLTIHISI